MTTKAPSGKASKKEEAKNAPLTETVETQRHR